MNRPAATPYSPKEPRAGRAAPPRTRAVGGGRRGKRARRLARSAPRSTPGVASELGAQDLETTWLKRRAVGTSVTVAVTICLLAQLESR